VPTATPTPAPEGTTSSLTGGVFASDYDRDDSNNPPLGNALVRLTVINQLSSDSPVYYELYTDESGNFNFESIPVGSYTLQVTKDGYISYLYDDYQVTDQPNYGFIYLDTAGLTATLSGIVTIADEDTDSGNNTLLPDIIITLTKLGSTTTPVLTMATDSSGIYSFDSLPLGIYELTISDGNYIPLSSEIILYNAGTSVYNITLEAISNNYAGTGTATGTIINALTGNGADAGLTLYVLRGYNISIGTVVATSTTGENGSYSLTLDAGNYTVYVVDERTDPVTRYHDGYFNIKVLGNITIGNQNGGVTPILAVGEIRIVLAWGALPSDLDSHLSGPTSDGGSFHTFYGVPAYSVSGAAIVMLDVDDTSSYGPETTTIYSQSDGIYRFSVHDFSNRRSSSSMALANSGAYVKVYIGDMIVTYYVPNLEGTAWDVFEYNSMTGELYALNTMYYESDPDDVGSTTGFAALYLGAEALDETDDAVTDDIEYEK
jgi:hypothetical protein